MANNNITLRNRVYSNLEKRRQKLLDGDLNRIPSPFIRFSDDFIGIEQDCYLAVTSFTKGGKSQFTSYTFIYEPLMYCYSHRDSVDMKILYFPLEETPERVMQRFISWLLYDSSNGAVRISPRDLRSTVKPLGKEILDMITAPAFQDILKFFEERVFFYTDFCNPTGKLYLVM